MNVQNYRILKNLTDEDIDVLGIAEGDPDAW